MAALWISLIIGLVSIIAVLLVRGRAPRPARPTSAGNGAALPVSAPAAPAPAPPAPPPIEDPQLRRLFDLRTAVMNAPRMFSPDDLFQLTSFRELVDGFAEPPMETERLLEFWQSEDAIYCWGALCALARRPRDERIEARLLARINSFHFWSRHFLLRVLETWTPEDPLLAARVLLHINDAWEGDAIGVILDQFLHRRAAVAPLTLTGVEAPAAFDRGDLGVLLRRYVDPALAGPLLDQLNAPPFVSPPNAGEKKGVEEQAPAELARAPLDAIGQLRGPGKIRKDRSIGHPSADAALRRVRAALLGKPQRCALVVGEAGVGKTSLVQRLASELSAEGWTIFEAGGDQINAGMMFTGSLGQRLQILRRELSKPKVLWIVPDFHQLHWSGRHVQNPTGILEMLMPALEAGEILILGETRPGPLESVLADRPEVRRLFEIVRIDPPTESEVAAMLEVWAERRAARERVAVPPAVRSEAMGLARQYLSSQTAPGGVLGLLGGALDDVVARAGGKDNAALEVADLVAALARLSGLPHEILDERRTLDLDAVRRHFESRVVGQPEAVRCLVDRLALLKAGITDPTRPIGVFLFAGPSGTGKTELAKTLADYLFGSPDRLVRLDMSELQDPGAFDRVLGSRSEFGPMGNSLAERVRRRPFCVVLLDEFEKAHPRVWDLFLQVFDDGRLTDPQGETTDLRQAIIILTSNLGSSISGEARLGLVGADEGFSPAAIGRAVERAFRPELRNRLDRVVIFRPLTREVMRSILRKELAEAFARRGLRRREWAVELEESAIELLVERGFSPTLGARPLKRALEDMLLTPLAAAIVDRRAPEGDQFLFVRANGDQLAVEFVDPDAPEVAPGPAVAPGHAELTAIVLDGRGSRAEVESLHAALGGIRARIDDPAWQGAKQKLLLEAASPDFWKRDDRFERLGRTEYLDRIESAARAAGSLLERIEGHPAAPRESYPRDVVRRLAQQLHLLEAASREALAEGPREAFVAIEPMLDDTAPAAPAREFAGRLAGMYAAWARARGMRFAQLETPDPAAGSDVGEPRYLLAIAGFAAYALLQPEEGLHVLEEEDGPGGRIVRRPTVRVRVLAQPAEPARDGASGLLQQARERLALRPATTTAVARRYREGSSPLVRDTVRGWRTRRIDRVLAGDFDLIPARE